MPFINSGPIDQLVDIDVLHQKRLPIDQSAQLINWAQQLRSPMGYLSNKTTPLANEVPLVGWHAHLPMVICHFINILKPMELDTK